MRFEPNFESTSRQQFKVHARVAGRRIDQYLKARYKDYSRSFFTRLIAKGQVLVNGQSVRPAYKTRIGDRIEFDLPALERPYLAPEPMDLDILYEDDWIVAINKPPGMVMHPSRGHQTGTLVNGLIHRYQGQLSGVRSELRPGLIHRLDRDTSGVVIVAKDDRIHWQIAAQFEKRTIQKKYLAVVYKRPAEDRFEVDHPIGRHPKNPDKMAIRPRSGKEAATRFEVLERFACNALVVARPCTGRTHQIRIHLKSIGHPIVADELYGGANVFYPGEALQSRDRKRPEGEEPVIRRQALHAHQLRFWHPAHEAELVLEAPLPEDIRALIEILRASV